MTRATFLLREALISLRRNALVVTGAVLAVFISLTLALGALVVNEVLRVNTVAWQQGVHVIAFLKDPAQGGGTVAQDQALLREVQGWPEVKKAFYVDKPGAWIEFQQLFANRPDMIDNVNPAVLPASIRIELNDITTYRQVQYRLQANPLVAEVRASGDQIEQLSTVSRVLNLLGLGLAVVLGLSAIILISNTIRMAIYARRDEVSIMKLVGAGNWFIRVPFILEGMIEGILGAGLAVGVVWIAAQNLKTIGSTIKLLTFALPSSFFVQWGVVFVLFGAAAGVLGSFLGLSRYLREADGAPAARERVTV